MAARSSTPTRERTDPKWIRGPADELAIAEGCYFDEHAGAFVCDFIEQFCRQSKGRWAGKAITLLDWQRDFLMRLFGWKTAEGLRRYKRSYLEVAKKNGKSTLVSALVLFFLLADGEGAPEVYLNACDREQASIVFDEARRMVDASPDFKRRLELIDSKADKRIVDPIGNGKIVANSSVAGSKDGLNPSAVIFDELHRQPDRQLWAVFEFAAVAREQPLTISITTAGEAAEGVWFEQREYSDKVNAGEIPDVTHLGVVYRALEEDDVDDPETWRKANPSLGATIKEDDFRRDLTEAKQDPEKWANFRRLRLNIITREESKAIEMADWNAPECCVKPRARKGEPCFGGLDLSSTDDLSALVWTIGDEEDGLDVRAQFFLPEDDIVVLERRNKVPYRAWADAGWIILTPGNVIDYGFIRRAVNDLAEEQDLRKLFVDPYNATKLVIELKESDGIEVEFFRQGFLSLSSPTKELLRLIRARKIRHGGNPVLRWMAGNCVAQKDEAGNLKFSKKKSRHKIDGLAGLVNATAARTSDPEAVSGSVYETRGVLTL